MQCIIACPILVAQIAAHLPFRWSALPSQVPQTKRDVISLWCGVKDSGTYKRHPIPTSLALPIKELLKSSSCNYLFYTIQNILSLGQEEPSRESYQSCLPHSTTQLSHTPSPVFHVASPTPARQVAAALQLAAEVVSLR